MGALSDLEIAGLGEDGSLLCVGQAVPSGDRVLLLRAGAVPFAVVERAALLAPPGSLG